MRVSSNGWPRVRSRRGRCRGSIDHSTLGIGTTRVAVNGSFDNRPNVMQLDLHIHGKQLPVDELEPLLPVFGVVLPKNSSLSGGSLGVDMHARARSTRW